MSDPSAHKDAYISADDVILRGYCGPVEMLGLLDPGVWTTTAFGAGGMANGADYKRLRLNPTLAPVRDHIARVMAEGMRCPACKGSRCQPSPVAFDPDDPCEACDGSGYLLPPAPIEHLMDRPGSRLTAAQSAVLVADSYVRWQHGLPIVARVLGPWRGPVAQFENRRSLIIPAPHPNSWNDVLCIERPGTTGAGWRMYGDPTVSGPETGPEGRACADRAALAHNFALLNDDGSVTTPDLPTDRSPN